ncbi:MAG: 16S rRNA (guanine(527)-N(7))-methyltransferase RsmG [Firmicutes bacterium]|nr:16S rRNA (guanine(527)-N(7))-methyltransferase RsmG [Bacillota bacterium]
MTGRPGLEGLEAYCREMGIDLEPGQSALLRRFWAMVLEQNARVNLTRITDDREAVLKHFVDSLTVLRAGVIHAGAKVADVGTGAGFPGVPLAIARPDVRVLLVEATGKRVKFLEGAVGALGLKNVEVLHERAEELARRTRGAGVADAVTARAVAPLYRLVAWCVPLLRAGGHLVAMKGPDVSEELGQAEQALGKAGARVAAVHRLELPGGAGGRTLLVIRREAVG